MAWFELHEQFANHPKIARLSRALSVSKVQTRGHIVTLWCWVASYAQDGNLSGYDASDIAAAADWEGDPTQFVSALKSAGWMDPDGVVHDWEEHGLRLLNNMRERQGKRRDRVGDVEHWAALRVDVLRRDAYSCAYCGKKATTVDHVIPVARGGKTDTENLVACCRYCNSSKKDKTPEEAGFPWPKQVPTVIQQSHTVTEDGVEQSRDSLAEVSERSRPTDLPDHTDPTDLSDRSEILVVDAQKRERAETPEALKEMDFVLRPDEKEFDLWVQDLKRSIHAENACRPRNPFTWKPQTGSFESDMKGLIYRTKDDVKTKLLYDAYNVLHEKLNWPNYVAMAVKYTCRASDRTRIASPYGFTVSVLRRPGELVSARSDGILAGVAV